MLFTIDNGYRLIYHKAKKMDFLLIASYKYKEVICVVSSVYNYYLSTYRNKEMSKYDSHKKSELQDVYNAMLKINRKSPLYKLGDQAEVQKYAIDIKESARDFKNVAAALTNDDGSIAAFSRKKAGSTNENLVSVEYIGQPEEETAGFDIRVKSLAKSQVNVSEYLDPEEHAVSPGSYSFDLSIGKYTYEFSFDVSEKKSNREVQNQIARLINRADIGLNAGIQENSEGETALSIVSENTGLIDLNKKGLTFEIVHNEKSEEGNIVELLGLDQVVSKPGNALFEINGEEHASTNNQFTVMKNFKVRLNNTGDETVQIEMKPDFDSMMENVTELVDVYNSMVDMAMTHAADGEDSDRLLNEIQRTAKHYKEGLDSAGFTVLDDGHIQIEESILVQSAEEGNIEEGLEQLNSLKKALVRKADDMSVNPMNYVNKKMIVYPNPVRNFTSPYVSSIYSGMMFNGYV